MQSVRIRSFVLRLSSLAVLAVLLGGCALTPTEYRPPPPLSAGERHAHNRQVFDRAWQLVRAKFFDAKFRGVDWSAQRDKYLPVAEAAPDENRLYAVLARMLGELKESHLAALAPKASHELRTQHRAAVGMRWRVVEGHRVVTDLVPGSPAELAGVQRGWIVVSRDGHPLEDEPAFTNAVGKTVTYGFVDAQDRPHSVTMTAGLLSFDRHEARSLDGGALYLRFDRFDLGAARWVNARLKERRNAPATIVDLRQNSGGSAVSLFLLLGEFLDHRAGLGTVVRRNGASDDWKSLRWFPSNYQGRVVILLDNFSASSAEIFSHVLQHNRRATVIGRQSAGAVIVARFYSLPGGGRLEVPVEDYIGLDGQRLEGRGVTPDTPVPIELIELRAGRDPDLEAALRLLKSPDGRPSISPSQPARPSP